MKRTCSRHGGKQNFMGRNSLDDVYRHKVLNYIQGKLYEHERKGKGLPGKTGAYNVKNWILHLCRCPSH